MAKKNDAAKGNKGDVVEKPLAEMSLDELRAERERLEVLHLRHTVEKEQTAIAARARAVEAQQQSLDDANAQIIAQQGACRHKKGGKDLGGILAGDGIKGGYSIIQHTYANGDIGIHCTRCSKAWFKPGCRMQQACEPGAFAAQKKSREEHDRQMADFVQALNWPSDNTPSGTQTHLIQRTA